jgi:hypothetical protein
MADQKLRISRDELYSPEVDEKLKRQEALTRAAQHTQLQADAHLPLPAPPRRRRFWYNPILATAFFGLLGGLSAWGLAEGVLRWMDASKGIKDMREVELVFNEEDKLFAQFDEHKLTEQQLHDAHEKLLRDHAQNPILAILVNKSLSTQEKEMLVKQLVDKEKPRTQILEMLLLCVVGVCLAFFLAVADPVLGRNGRAAIVNGSVGVLLGLLGGALVALFIDKLYWWLGGGHLHGRLSEQMLARTLCWGLLGLFLAIAPGVALRSWKRLAIGLVGGLVGGLLGGLLFDPLGEMTHSGLPARLLALTAIGVLTGGGTGLIEQAAKRGWLYVTAGLIAGKQFILYRNPTFIGSSPRCEVYLFKDPDISPQHAALHQIPGGFELEDLGSATGTRVNGRPVKRRRLRSGDQVQIGSTCLLFQEKARARAAEDGERESVPALAERAPAPEGSFTP